MEKGSLIHNRYEILSRVGAGGMSDVYKAKDHKLNRNVAVKVLKKEFSNDKNFVSKFKTEARSAASLIHPNIVNVYDVGEDQGTYYIVMELIEGITLKQYIQKKGRLSLKETISIALQIANGIECAHNNQIVHRDIKPQNIMISREGKVKVTDFGIARAASASTLTGNAMGSVHYISPEQAGGKYVDEKSDIYSLGITMYEMLTGKVPFNGETTVSIALMHIQNSVPSVREIWSDVPVSIEKIILKCTQNKADYRYPKISALTADLKRAYNEPDVDFVQLEQVPDTTSTIMITDDEINQIHNASGDPEHSTDISDYGNDDIDVMSPKMDRLATMGGVVIGVIALVIVGVVLTNLVFSYIYSPDVTFQASVNSSQKDEGLPQGQAKVPSVIGMSQEEAEKLLNENHLGCDVVQWEHNDEYSYGQIISQDIAPGKVVDIAQTTVKLVASYGGKKIKVPDGLVGKDVNVAVKRLQSVGLEWEVRYEFSGATIDSVIKYTPKGKSEVSKGDVIHLTVSRGRESGDGLKVANVPDVVGKRLSQAQAALEKAGYKSGTVKKIFSNTVKKDVVIRQSIQSRAPLGTTVYLVISKGTESASKAYKAQCTIAREDLLDRNGNVIRSGNVTAVLNGEPVNIDSAYKQVENWKGDYTMNLSGDEKGIATLYLYVNGIQAFQTTVKLQ